MYIMYSLVMGNEAGADVVHKYALLIIYGNLMIFIFVIFYFLENIFEKYFFLKLFYYKKILSICFYFIIIFLCIFLKKSFFY